MKEQRLGKEEEEEEESGFARTTGEENGRGETNGMGGRMFRFARSLSLSPSLSVSLVPALTTCRFDYPSVRNFHVSFSSPMLLTRESNLFGSIADPSTHC